MNKKSIVVIILALILIGGGAYYFLYQNAGPASEAASRQSSTSGMLGEKNAVIVSEQRPGKRVIVSAVHLASPGFVVIHDDISGAPGAIIGASALLRAGETTNIMVVLTRAAKDGERLHAMLHSDPNGDGTFNESSDMPVQSTLGGPLEGWFEISSSVGVDTPVSI